MAAAGKEARFTDFSSFRVFQWNLYYCMRTSIKDAIADGQPPNGAASSLPLRGDFP